MEIVIQTPIIRQAKHYEELGAIESMLKELTGEPIQAIEIEPTNEAPKDLEEGEEAPKPNQYAAIFYLPGEKIDVDMMIEEGEIKPCNAY